MLILQIFWTAAENTKWCTYCDNELWLKFTAYLYLINCLNAVMLCEAKYIFFCIYRRLKSLN